MTETEASVEFRVPPHDIEAEGCVLSACLLDPDALPRVRTILRASDFYAERHRRIFEACETVTDAGDPVDVRTVCSQLQSTSRLAQVGGVPYVTEMMASTPATANVEAHAELVARKARLRAMQATLQRLVAESYVPTDDEDLWLDRAEQLVHDVGIARPGRTRSETMSSAVEVVFAKLQEASQRGLTGVTGLATGFSAIDEQTGGLFDGESTVVAGRPGMGKTGLVMNIATNVARRGLGVVVFSLEMPNEQIATRVMCSDAGVDVRKARTNKFDRNDWSKLTEAASRAHACKHLHLIDKPSGLLHVRSEVRQRALEMQRAGVKLGLVVVDYLQLMEGREGARSREESVSDNARGLKLLAKEMGCAVIALSQLNRGVEQRNDKRPMLSDLRESGAIEEAADCVIGMYRDDYYHDESKTPGIVELGILKHRHGPTGTVELGFEARTVTFKNLPDNQPQWAAE